MQRDAGHDERDADELEDVRQLAQDDDTDRRGGRREQRDEHGVRCARQPRHRELVEHVRDHGGAHPDAEARGERDRIGERVDGSAEADRRDEDEGEQHRRREPVDPARPRDTVRDGDVRGEQRGVREREDDAERLALEPDVREHVDAAGGDEDRRHVARHACAEQRQQDRADELDCGDGCERQPVDRLVEARVHRREDAAQRRDLHPALAVERAERAPRPPP
jgi:hypothetical protein